MFVVRPEGKYADDRTQYRQDYEVPWLNYLGLSPYMMQPALIHLAYDYIASRRGSYYFKECFLGLCI
jgi:hypothetical protein